MFSLLKKYELRGAKRRVRLFNRFRIESVLKIAPYHTLKFGGIGELQYLCIVIQEGCTRQSAPHKVNNQHFINPLKIKDDESKYLENNFADCNLLPYSHRYYARSYQL